MSMAFAHGDMRSLRCGNNPLEENKTIAEFALYVYRIALLGPKGYVPVEFHQ